MLNKKKDLVHSQSIKLTQCDYNTKSFFNYKVIYNKLIYKNYITLYYIIMNTMQLLKLLLTQVIDDLDSGNSNLNEQQCLEVIDIIKKYNPKLEVDKELTMTDICNKYHITRQTFYRKVKEGIIPEGIKKPGRNPYWKESVIKEIFK